MSEYRVGTRAEGKWEYLTVETLSDALREAGMLISEDFPQFDAVAVCATDNKNNTRAVFKRKETYR